MNAHQLVREYVKRVAEISPLYPRLRKLKGPKMSTGESEALADIIDRATRRVCGGAEVPKPLRRVYSKLPYFIRSATFFEHPPSDAKTMLLCHYALDAARKEYIKQTSVSGGAPLDPKKPKFDIEAEENLARLTEAGSNPLAIERQLQRDADDAAREARERVEAAEDARLCAAGVEYFHTLTNRQHQRVFHALCRADETDKAIKGRFGVAAKTVSDIRRRLESLAEEIQTEPPEGGAPDIEAPDTLPEDGMLTRIADADGLDRFDLAATLHAPEVDEDASEKNLHSYARRDSGFARGSGVRMYRDKALVTGIERRFDNEPICPTKVALRAERELMAEKSAQMVEAMQELAAKFGVSLETLLNSAAVHRALRSTDDALASTIEPKI